MPENITLNEIHKEIKLLTHQVDSLRVKIVGGELHPDPSDPSIMQRLNNIDAHMAQNEERLTDIRNEINKIQNTVVKRESFREELSKLETRNGYQDKQIKRNTRLIIALWVAFCVLLICGLIAFVWFIASNQAPPPPTPLTLLELLK